MMDTRNRLIAIAIAATLCGCAQRLALPEPLEGETVQEGHLCDPRALLQAIAHKFPGIDPVTAQQQTDHLLYKFGCGLLASAPSTVAAASTPESHVHPVPPLTTQVPNEEVRLEPHHGVFAVPVVINRSVKIPFVVDSGAADVQLPGEVVLTLIRSGTVSEADFLGKSAYVLADGTRLRSPRLNIREMRVGDYVVRNVAASVGEPVSSSALLGQSFLSKFASWTLDNQRHVLILSSR
jgi:clan AA aspartic protease (TIGR02281 family)